MRVFPYTALTSAVIIANRDAFRADQLSGIIQLYFHPGKVLYGWLQASDLVFRYAAIFQQLYQLFVLLQRSAFDFICTSGASLFTHF